ncbi:MAG: CDP-diacylglycerol--serine O-phosphatidyltransferase [Moritella sp.]|jgi:CDP-diacylglycerol--serine O-phosphatidyltransferase
MKSLEFYQSTITNLKQLPLSVGHLDVLFSARDFKAKILDLIASSSKRIYLSALYLEDDEAGREMLDALYQARRRHSDLVVKVFVDFHRAQRGLIGQKDQGGNATLYKEMRKKLGDKIEILGVPVKAKEVLGVLHLKGFVFDDTVLYSGASINDIYLHQAEKYRCDRYHVLYNPSLADTMVAYLEDNFVSQNAVTRLDDDTIPSSKALKQDIRQFKQTLHSAQYRYIHKTPENNEIGLTPISGFGRHGNKLNQTITHLLRAVENEVTIYTPYFNLPISIAKDIKRLLKRNVKVTLVIGEKTANDFYIPPTEPFKIISALPYIYETFLYKFVKTCQPFIDKGLLNVQLWKEGAHSFHLKGISCDFKYHLLTGNNLNPRAWGLDLENGILLHDKNQLLKDIMQSEQELIMSNTRRIKQLSDLESMADYPLPVQKFMRRIKTTRLDVLLKRIL